MMKLTGSAYAKINISLDVISKMDDGYHNMLMVMQSVSLCDEVTIICEKGSGIKAESELPYLPCDKRNIAVKAALAFFEHTGIIGFKTTITLKKLIPVCAGLGGGSSDGACVLRILDDLFQTNLGIAELEKLGAGIGSDVPFCVAGGTRLAQGKGEDLSDLPKIPGCYFVICKPPFAISTPDLFSKIKCDKIRARPDTKGIVEALAGGDLSGISRRMYNVFEDVLPRGESEIAAIKYSLLESGAVGAVMSGTGPAVFGIFESENNAQKAYENLKGSYKSCFLVQATEKLT